MADPKRIGLSGQARGIDPQRQRRNSLTTDETVAEPLTLNEKGQITLGLGGPLSVDGQGNLVLSVAPPLVVTNNSPLTLSLKLDSNMTVNNDKLAAYIPQATINTPGLAPALNGSQSSFLSGDGVYRAPIYPVPKLDECAPPSDTTSLDASTSAHGLLPKLSGSPTDVLLGDGTWGAGGGGVTDHGLLTGLADDDHTQYVLASGGRSGWPTPTVTPTAGSLPLADGSGTLNSWVTSVVTDHGLLTGLADDDHTQYVLADGTRANWPMPYTFTTTEDYMQTTVANPDQCYIANVRTGVALGTKALAANTEYWIPFVAPCRGAQINNAYIQVTTASSGTSVIVGLYDCKSNGSGYPDTSDFRPTGSPLASTTQSTAATGTFALSWSYTLTGGRLYWMCILSSGAPTLRGGSTNSVDIALGWTLPTGTTAPTAVTHWTSTRTFASGLRTGMTGTETYTNGTGAQPSVFYTFGT